MKSLAFFNNKGGVGKTTLLCNIAAYFSQEFNARVCVVDADPQCNATQYLLEDSIVEDAYSKRDNYSIFSVIQPLSYGEGYSDELRVYKSERFEVDVVIGDPRLALTEDLLARDWGDAKAGDIRGIRTNLVFAELLKRLDGYDYVFFDVSPSLGAINRSILLAADRFISPMSIDIFSLMAFENISRWIEDWWREWSRGLDSVRERNRIPQLTYGPPSFIGYVTQQYLAKKDASGERRAVQAYERIRAQIDGMIEKFNLDLGLNGESPEIGSVPNLFSLIPMSQSKHVPVFGLTSADGVVGAHFAKVKDAKIIFGGVAEEIYRRLNK